MLADSLQFLFLIFYFLPTCSGITIGAVRVVVLEGGEAVFPVSIGRDAKGLLFDWRKVGTGGEVLREVFMYDAGVHYNNGRSGQSEQFKGRVSHFPAELKHGNTSIVIRNAKVIDSGIYTCYFPRLQPPQTFYFELDVDLVFNDRSGENPAATPKPRVTTLNDTADWSYLQCEVPGASLNTKAEWQNSTGYKIDAEEKRGEEKDHEHVFISLYANVSRTDLYLCVVSQEDIKHRVSAQTFVFINEKEKKMERKDCYSTGAMVMVGVLLGAVIVIAVQALLVFAKRIKILHNKGSRLKRREEINLGNGLSNGTNGYVIDPSEEPLQSDNEC